MRLVVVDGLEELVPQLEDGKALARSGQIRGLLGRVRV